MLVTGFLPGALLYPADGGEMFLLNVKLIPNYTGLQSRSSYPSNTDIYFIL
jgi:hypothetical protein